MTKFRMGYNYCSIIDQTHILDKICDYFEITVDQFQDAFQGYHEQNKGKKGKHVLRYEFFLYVAIRARDIRRAKSLNNRIRLEDDFVNIDDVYFYNS